MRKWVEKLKKWWAVEPEPSPPATVPQLQPFVEYPELSPQQYAAIESFAEHRGWEIFLDILTADARKSEQILLLTEVDHRYHQGIYRGKWEVRNIINQLILMRAAQEQAVSPPTTSEDEFYKNMAEMDTTH